MTIYIHEQLKVQSRKCVFCQLYLENLHCKTREFVSPGKLWVHNYKLINIWNTKFSEYFADRHVAIIS